MTNFYITFGPDDEKHGPSWLDHHGYVTVTATDIEDAREIATKWFSYTEQTPMGEAFSTGFCDIKDIMPEPRFFPLGRIGYASRDELRRAER
jgi:hypothetical protein